MLKNIGIVFLTKGNIGTTVLYSFGVLKQLVDKGETFLGVFGHLAECFGTSKPRTEYRHEPLNTGWLGMRNEGLGFRV